MWRWRPELVRERMHGDVWTRVALVDWLIRFASNELIHDVLEHTCGWMGRVGADVHSDDHPSMATVGVVGKRLG